MNGKWAELKQYRKGSGDIAAASVNPFFSSYIFYNHGLNKDMFFCYLKRKAQTFKSNKWFDAIF